MVWLLEFGLVLIVVGVAAAYASKGLRGRTASEREVVTERRVEAYMQTLRRDAGNADLAAMSDLELRDLLLSSARNLRIESERRFWVLLGAGLVAIVSAILVASQDGTRGFAIALAVGAVVLYGLNEYLSRRIREPLRAQGLDAERLRVE
jgi:type II secretory pathway component PulM